MFIIGGMKKYMANKNDKLISRSQARDFDNWAINSLGIAAAVLMENAGRSCAELILEKLATVNKPKVCVLCGIGNNGGDGFVIARHLINAKVKVETFLSGDKTKITGHAKVNLDVLEKISPPVEVIDLETDIEGQIHKVCSGCDIIVDAVFGSGLVGDLRGNYPALIDAVNACKIPIMAVDIPSGLDCDNGRPNGNAIKAKWTVTFIAAKIGFAKSGAAEYTGQIYVASIGAELDSWPNLK